MATEHPDIEIVESTILPEVLQVMKKQLEIISSQVKVLFEAANPAWIVKSK